MTASCEKKPYLFSVIIPVYNVLTYLREGLDSLVHELAEDLQVILIDDGSTDGSSAVCDEYAHRYAQFIVIHQPNGGVAAARNRGLQASSGQYLLWFDPDDRLLPGWLSAIREAIQQDMPDLLLFDYVQEQNGRTTPMQYGRAEGAVAREVFFLDLARDFRLTSVLWNKAIRREWMENVRFNEELRCLEDYVLLYQVAFDIGKIIYLPKQLYAYRIREDGLVRSPNLSVGYQSYLESVKRMKQIKAHQLPSHILGVLLQAKGFCCKYYISHMPREYADEYRACKRFLHRHAGDVLRDGELPFLEKCKYLLIPFTLVGKIYACMTVNHIK